jgi:hypothetical protein
MERDHSKPIAIFFCAVAIVVGITTFGYREYLQRNSDWITRTLCEDRPVATGKYGKCLAHYAPAASNDF